MSERGSLYQGTEVELAKQAVVLSGSESSEKRRKTKEQLRREEMRPSIQAAQKKLAEKVLVPLVDKAWRAYTLCSYLPFQQQEYFTSGNQEDVERAKLVCESCDVKEQCLAYALENNETFYVYGGKTEKERRSARRAGIVNRRWERLNGR